MSEFDKANDAAKECKLQENLTALKQQFINEEIEPGKINKELELIVLKYVSTEYSNAIKGVREGRFIEYDTDKQLEALDYANEIIEIFDKENANHDTLKQVDTSMIKKQLAIMKAEIDSN